MSTVQEIQAAIRNLPEPDRFELINWLHSHYHHFPVQEEAELVREAEEGFREIREGKGVLLEELYQQTGSWTSR